jgi:hypothetical protein
VQRRLKMLEGPKVGRVGHPRTMLPPLKSWMDSALDLAAASEGEDAKLGRALSSSKPCCRPCAQHHPPSLTDMISFSSYNPLPTNAW